MRALITLIDEAARRQDLNLRQASLKAAQADAEAQELAEFDAHEAADKQRRFEAWKLANQSGGARGRRPARTRAAG